MKRDFLENYADNPLSADMYYDSAIEALVEDDKEKALGMLEIIELRYRQSKIVTKARKLRDSIKDIN